MVQASEARRRPPGSPWEEHLIDLFETHLKTEASVLESYEGLAKASDDEYIGYLVGLIVDDERRHHALFSQMLNTIRSEVEWRDVKPNVPSLRFTPNSRRAELIEHTNRLLEIERDDARALRVLKRELKPVAKTSLLSLLVEMMEADTAKHVGILERIKASLRRSLIKM
jgi:rubrerythrin